MASNPHEAAEALAARTRLSIGKEWPLPAGSPAAHTGTAMALLPMLEKLTGEIATTGDYFEFQRLAGRASELTLSHLGARISGFAGWLSDMLQVGVTDAGRRQRRQAARAQSAGGHAHRPAQDRQSAL